MPRSTLRIPLMKPSFGTERSIVVHTWKPDAASAGEACDVKLKKAYLQGSLHADEYPGMLVLHHLSQLLDEAAATGSILQEIVIVPFANPIGLSQRVLGNHLGRFGLETGTNFNREWFDFADIISGKIRDRLTSRAESNVEIIRSALLEEIQAMNTNKEEQLLKKTLYKMAVDADLVLDLHCDSDAVMHMYTHERLWPQMQDLAAEIQSECTLLAGASGGNPFDEAFSCPWAFLADKFPEFPIPMACQSATLELRGELDVSDELASGDARALFRFLQSRGFIASALIDQPVSDTPNLLRDALPLTAVDMIQATKAGIVAWKVRPGDYVVAGQLLGEIVDIEDHTATRIAIVSGTDGLVYGMKAGRLVRSGEIVIKVSGDRSLDWRKGNLLNV